jgi:catechol 2,3-dioxygenase-like lactoylglutathione lyase family enzyme
MTVQAIDHVQLAMPPGEEAAAISFYEGLLGLSNVAKPAHLAARGGCWFEHGPVKVHLGVEADFRPARKAHPALLVDDLDALSAQLGHGGFPVREGDGVDGFRQCYVDDPFGNRIELLERLTAA